MNWPLTQAAQAYVQRLQALGREQPLLLAAHAYVRYLGDLNGGQMLSARVARQLQLAPGQGLAFYDFGPGVPVDVLQQTFRQCLLRVPDAALPQSPGATPARAQLEIDVVQEACSAFLRHRALFEELDAPRPLQLG